MSLLPRSPGLLLSGDLLIVLPVDGRPRRAHAKALTFSSSGNDPLDRVSTVTPSAQAVANRFYNGEQLMTELHGDRQRTCIRAGAQWLAQQSREGDEVVTI
jgi:hypothetical protein